MGILSITVGSSICGFASWKVLRVARKHGRCFSFSSINQYQSVGKVNTQRNKTNPQKSQEQINYINGDVGDVAKKNTSFTKSVKFQIVCGFSSSNRGSEYILNSSQ
jgi:hypothetical protein